MGQLPKFNTDLCIVEAVSVVSIYVYTIVYCTCPFKRKGGKFLKKEEKMIEPERIYNSPLRQWGFSAMFTF